MPAPTCWWRAAATPSCWPSDLAREVRQAIEYARIFDTAAAIFFPGCFASRRNYDIAQGRDGNGRERFGVLEQSWRVGGASSAEIAALEAFRADPGLPAVRAASFEIHEDKRLPDNSRVIYRGPDEHGDFLLKYAMTGRHDGEQRTHPHRGRRRPDRRHLPQPPGEGSRRALRARLGRQPAARPEARPWHRRARLRVPDLRPARPRRGKRAPGAGDARGQPAGPARRLRPAGGPPGHRQRGDRGGRHQLWRLPGGDPQPVARGALAGLAGAGDLPRRGLADAQAAARPRGSQRIPQQPDPGRQQPSPAGLRGIPRRCAAGGVGVRQLCAALDHHEFPRRLPADPFADPPDHRPRRPCAQQRGGAGRLYLDPGGLDHRDGGRRTSRITPAYATIHPAF